MSLLSFSASLNGPSTTGSDDSLTQNDYLLQFTAEIENGFTFPEDGESSIDVFKIGEEEDGNMQVIFWVEPSEEGGGSFERNVHIVCPKVNTLRIDVKERNNSENVMLTHHIEEIIPVEDMDEHISGKPISKRRIYNIPHNPQPF